MFDFWVVFDTFFNGIFRIVSDTLQHSYSNVQHSCSAAIMQRTNIARVVRQWFLPYNCHLAMRLMNLYNIICF